MNEQPNPVRAIAVITAFCLMGDSMLYVLLPFYWQEAGLHSLFEAGILLSINRLIRLPLAPFIGRLLQKIPFRLALLFAVTLAACTTVAYGYANGFWAWFVLRALWGFTWSLLRLGALYAIADASLPNEHGKNTGIYNGLYRLGSLAGMLFGGIIAQAWGFTATSLLFGALASLSLLLLPAIATATDSDKRTFFSMPAQQGQKSTCLATRAYASPQLLLVLGSGAVIAMLFQGIFTSTLSHVVDTHFHEGMRLGPSLLGAVTLAGFLSAIRWGWEPFLAPLVGRTADRLKKNDVLLMLSLLTAAPLFALVPLPLTSILWLVLIVAVQLSATALTTLCDAAATRTSSGMPSGKAFLTLYSILQDVGAALGPLLGYLVLTNWLYLGSAVMLLCLAICWYTVTSKPTGKRLKITSL
ncbi:MFS transporter [Brevibacillus fluminis]|uniref:MFS transporter n=1 Tax=Brevibacillus fluminis TaxID=511487 RepID=A0A3M8DQ99_9BACL|nr:MFS transporter [Brevibacillus fluminis]RNB89605.1 MFS transporter [Brevibacillus fluminis]